MNWKVRFIDYPSQFREMRESIMSTIESVLTNGDLMLREQLREFEKHLAEFVGTRYAVGTSNCTDALMLCLRAAGIGPGDEVISVSHTFVATIASIHHVGANPVLIDIGDDHNMNIGLVEAAITPRTKAIVPVHLNGRVCDMTRLMAIAKRYQLVVIEDSAQALGASCDSIRGGAFGDAGCFSFYPAKLLGAYGDAGAVVTNRQDMAEKIRRLRDHGRTPEGDIDGWSFNCRLDNLQAALLDLKLARLSEWIHKRRELAGRYHAALSSLPQVHLPPPPIEGGRYYDVYQNYEILAQDRDRLVAYLKNNGIEILIPWGGKGVHQFKALGLSHFNLPATDNLFQNSLMLPLHTELTEVQVDYVSATIRGFYASS